MSGTSTQSFESVGVDCVRIIDSADTGKLNKEIQRDILVLLKSCYPDPSVNIIREQHQDQDLANLYYLNSTLLP